jgi:hypothetical protein
MPPISHRAIYWSKRYRAGKQLSEIIRYVGVNTSLFFQEMHHFIFLSETRSWKGTASAAEPFGASPGL